MLRGLFVAASVAASSAGDACVGFSKDLEKGECAAWLEFYDAVIPAPPKGPGARVAEAFPATAAPAASPAAPPPHPPPGAIANRTDPCNTGHSQRVVCSDDGKHILALDFGGRGLAGVLPSMAGFDHLTYLMLAFNNLTGPAPSGLNYSAVDGCGYGARGAQESCCFLTSTTSNVYDESADSGVTNAFDCPLPAGAAEYCHGTCGAGGATPEHDIASAADDDAPSALPGGFSDKCRQCTPASKATYPQCDVRKSLAWHGGHVAAAFCTDVDLVRTDREAQPGPDDRAHDRADEDTRPHGHLLDDHQPLHRLEIALGERIVRRRLVLDPRRIHRGLGLGHGYGL